MIKEPSAYGYTTVDPDATEIPERGNHSLRFPIVPCDGNCGDENPHDSHLAMVDNKGRITVDRMSTDQMLRELVLAKRQAEDFMNEFVIPAAMNNPMVRTMLNLGGKK